jgi:hypothetical protein
VSWNGQWVADRLDARLITESAGPVQLPDLVGMALRRNPRRAQLLVSTVLGKHLPCDPRLVYGAGRLLGARVADVLKGTESGIADEGGQLLAVALDGDSAAAIKLLSLCDQHTALVRSDAVVVGFAETATALGHSVADALVAPYLHSTRRDDGGARAAMFVEEHSHATNHLLLPADPQLLVSPGPLVLVDDELSTGQTALNTIRALQATAPGRGRYLIASLVDLRSAADRARMAELATELGVQIEVISLAAGWLELPEDVLERGHALVAGQPEPVAGPAGTATGDCPVLDCSVLDWPMLDWPAGVIADGRHGFDPSELNALAAAAESCATRLAAGLRQAGAARVLVLGSEELMYAPLRIATALAELLDIEVRYSTTTRSPVLAVDDEAYAIRSRLEFPSHDDPTDGPGTRFAYNVTASERFTDIVLVIDDAGDTAALRAPGGLCDQLAGVTDRLRLVRIPAGSRALAQPLYGPAFGSYSAAEVSWLLTDLSGVRLEAPTEEREEAIQAGEAHYAESLPIEFQPSEQYQSLFTRALAESAAEVAQAVGVVTELVLAERGEDVVLASLARAGTPVGILMRRWAEQLHGLQLPHYAVSIVRGRGIDTVALRYLAQHHDPSKIVFVDGWTGKGAIARELAEAIAAANRALGTRFCSDLAVLADTGSCVRTFGTRNDYLIPSACLNSTVSGLVSRTVLNDDLIGPDQFHGAKFYAELAEADVSNEFLDAVSARFGEVRVPPVGVDEDREPTWAGWRAVEELSVRYGINDVNLVKPGVGETTRVLLRRVPWMVLMRRDTAAGLGHLRLLADQRGVEVELVDELAYSCVGLIRPGFSRNAR